MTHTRTHLLALLLAATASGAGAAEAIATDRPDFVESSDVVGSGRVQIETGLSFDRSSDAASQSRGRSTPTLLRVGVSDALELRVETDGRQFSRVTDKASGAVQRDRGWADTALGVKWHMADGDEASGKPAIAWLLHVDLDSGSPAFRGNGKRPSLRGVAEWELPDDVAVGVMAGAVRERNADGKRYTAGILAATMSKGWTDKLRTFVEVAGQSIASTKNGGSVWTLDAGITYLISDDVQVDTAVSRGLNKTSPDLQFGLGLSVRF